jgi:hypothetical protein
MQQQPVFSSSIGVFTEWPGPRCISMSSYGVHRFSFKQAAPASPASEELPTFTYFACHANLLNLLVLVSCRGHAAAAVLCVWGGDSHSGTADWRGHLHHWSVWGPASMRMP